MSDSMNRDLAIDVTRGLAIWSMITAHFADGAKLAMPTHAFPFVDGMSVFVLLSGLVLGLVHQRWITRNGLRFSYRRLAQRLVVLYLCQLLLALVAVAAGLAGYRSLTWLLPVSGWREGIWLSVTMQYLPSGGNILLLYMVLMASAFLLFPLLQRGWWPVVLLASIALYVVSQVYAPSWFYLTADMAAPRIQNWAGWQIMFVPALVVGWNWQRWDVAARIERHLPALFFSAFGVALIAHYGIAVGPWSPIDAMLSSKLDFGPARAIDAWVLVPVVYGLFRVFLSRWHKGWLRPLLQTGTRSLDSYVIQALALVVVPVFVIDRPWPPVTMSVIAVGVFAACWAWAEFRQACGIDKLHRLPVIAGAPVVAAIRPRRRRVAARSCTPSRPQRVRPHSTVLPPTAAPIEIAESSTAPRVSRRATAGAHS